MRTLKSLMTTYDHLYMTLQRVYEAAELADDDSLTMSTVPRLLLVQESRRKYFRYPTGVISLE